MEWTSIYQLFWGSLGTRVLTHPHLSRSLKPSHFALYQHLGPRGCQKWQEDVWGNDDKVWGWGVPNFNMYISIFYVCPQWFSICIVSTDFLGDTQPFLLLPQVFLKVSLRVPHVLSPCLFFVGPFLSMPTYLHVCCYFNGFRYVVFRFCVSGNRRICWMAIRYQIWFILGSSTLTHFRRC